MAALPHGTPIEELLGTTPFIRNNKKMHLGSHSRSHSLDAPTGAAMRRKLTLKFRLSLFLLGVVGALLLSQVFPAPTVSRAEDRSAHEGEIGAIALLEEGERSTGDAISDNEAPQTAGGDSNQKQARLIDKQIPDQKVLHGMRPMVIPLDGRFDETELAQGGGPLAYELLHNEEEEVVEATIDGCDLTLAWGAVGKSDITVRVTNTSTGQILDNKFSVEVWQPDYGKLVWTVIGGLGIFLLGMKNMSEGLQAVAGAGLRRMIGAVTDNRLLAIGVGTGVTVLIQSSSITTVMVVGFVNSGFMTLSQAIGVIMGANIGTTITGWILVLEIGRYGLAILGFAAFVYLFSKRDRIRYIALAVMGLGMVFFGLELMKNGFATVKDLPAFEAWFEQFTADTYLGVLKCASVGCVLTFIVQSSSATLGITISLTVTGVIPFETGAALVLGENIGTTITAFLASFGATINARRAAYFHMLFNMLGVAWVTAIFIPIYMPLVRSIIGTVPDPESGKAVVSNMIEAIALTHTMFNITNTILFIPFVRVFASLLERFIPERAVKEKPHLTSLDVRMLETSVIAIEQSRVEVLRMAHGCYKLAGWLKEIILQEVDDQELIQKAFHREEVLDTVQDEVVAFMAHLLAGNVPLDVANEARRQLRMADEYESVSDYLIAVLKSHLKLRQAGLKFPDTDFDSLLKLHDMVTDYLTLINEGFERRQAEVITKAKSQGEAITLRVKELRDQFLDQMSSMKLDPQVIVAYTAQLNAYRRVREHLLNVAEALAGEK